MTSPGHPSAQTPIAGLVDLALTAPVFAELAQRAAARPAELALVGPASAQLYATCALARGGPLLVVTATGREAEDLTAELRGVFGDAAVASVVEALEASHARPRMEIHDNLMGSEEALYFVRSAADNGNTPIPTPFAINKCTASKLCARTRNRKLVPCIRATFSINCCIALAGCTPING